MDTLMTPVPAGSPGMDLRAYCDHASKMRESGDIAQIASALVRAQAALASPPRNREVEVRTKTGGRYTFRYATLDKIMEVARPALGENGLCVLQPIVSTERGPALVTRLLHESGQWMECEIPLPRLGEDPQGFGSAVTYVRRYAVSAMLNITADEDDDGNTAAGNHVADAPRRDENQRGPARPVQDCRQGEARPHASHVEWDRARPANGAVLIGHDASGVGSGAGGSNTAAAHAPSRAQASQPVPAKSHGSPKREAFAAGLREAEAAGRDGEGSVPSVSPRQPAEAPSRAAQPSQPVAGPQASPSPSPGTTEQAAEAPATGATARRQGSNAGRRRKDEAAPPSVWGILRPGKPGVTAPNGAAWLKWWTDLAAKAAAGGKRDELRTLFEANAAGWDQIALGSAEGQDMVAQASAAVRAVLDG